MYFLTIVGKIVLQRINLQLTDLSNKTNAAELAKQGITKMTLNQQIQDLLYDLFNGARGI